MRKHFRVEHWDSVIWQEIKAFLKSHEMIEEGVERLRKTQQEANKPIQNRLDIIAKLSNEKRSKLDRLVDLYLQGGFEIEMLQERKMRLEAEIEALAQEHETLSSQIKEALTLSQVNELISFTRQVAQGLDEADKDFDSRQKIIKYLDTKVYFSLEDGQEVAYLHCYLGALVRLRKDGVKEPISFHPHESELKGDSQAEGEGNYSPIDKHSKDCRRS